MPRGRLSIFGSKEDGVRIQGEISKKGAMAFEAGRKKLAAMYEDIIGKKPAAISDADVVESMAVGVAGTRAALHDMKAKMKEMGVL